MRIRTRMIAVLAAGAVVLGGATPVHAEELDEPVEVVEIPDDLVVMADAYETSDFVEAAEELPEGLVEAVERDLGLSAEEYLAQAEAAVDAAEVLASLEEAGIEVAGSEMEGTELVVYVADPDLVPAVESTGATAVVGERDAVVVDTETEYEAYDDLYGGMSWGYFTSPTTVSRCSLGFSSWDGFGNDVELTAGHCFNSWAARVSGTNARLLPVTLPFAQGGELSAQSVDFGSLLAGSDQYGDGFDTGLLTTPAAGYIAKPQIVTYGSSDPNTAGGASDGYGAPFAAAGLPIYGKTTAVNGAPVCRSGATTGFTCGTVLAAAQAALVGGEQVFAIRTSACSLPGDSGGPLVTGNYALGVLSGGNWTNDGTTANKCNPQSGTSYGSVFFAIDFAAGTESSCPTGSIVGWEGYATAACPDVTAKYGSDWELMVDLATPVVMSSSGGAVGAAAPLSGTLAHAGPGTSVALFLNGSSTAADAVDASSGSWSFDLDSLEVGEYDYQVKALWGQHNVSAAASGSFDIVLESQTVTVTSTTHGTSPSSVSTVNPITGTVSPSTVGTQLKLYADNANTAADESATALSTVSPDGSGNWSFPLASLSPALAQGDWDFTVKSELDGVVTGQATGSFSIVGTHTPVVVSSWGNSLLGEAARWYGNVPFVDGLAVKLYLDAESTPRATASLSTPGGTPLGSKRWEFSGAVFDALPAGQHVFHVRAEWNGHTVGVWDSTHTLYTPIAPVVTSSPGGQLPTPTALSGTLAGFVPGTVVRLYLNGSSTATATATPSGGSGSWSFSLASLAAGSYAYAVQAFGSGYDNPLGQVSGSFQITAPPPPPGPDVSTLPNRIEGPDRYATAAEIGRVWDQFFDADVVFVATGENYPDALSAAAAAAHLGAPLVLTPKGSLPAVVKNRLNSLHPSQIVVLGSSAAVSNTVFNALKTVSGSPSVIRWQGPDRYATGREIVKRAFGVNGNGDGAENVNLHSVVIATGGNFPDALSAGPAVANVGGAVILVDGSKGSIPAATLNLIRDLEPQNIVIAGSTAAVRAGTESQLKSVFGSGKVKRMQGPDRYATAVAITNHFFDDADAVFFAVGTNFPDALAGAALAGALGAPLVVTPKTCMSAATKNAVSSLTVTKRVLLGSAAAISNNIANLKTC